MATKEPIFFYKKNCFIYPVMFVVFLLITTVCIIIVSMKTEISLSIIQNLISFFALIITGITLFFLYKTLKQQQEQIEDNKNEIEFNRAVDLIFKHIDASRDNLTNLLIQEKEELVNSIESFKKKGGFQDDNNGYNRVALVNNKRMINNINSALLKSIAYIKSHTRFYVTLVYKERFSIEQKTILYKVVNDALYSIPYRVFKNEIQQAIRIVKENLESTEISDKSLTLQVLTNVISDLSVIETQFNVFQETEEIKKSIMKFYDINQ